MPWRCLTDRPGLSRKSIPHLACLATALLIIFFAACPGDLEHITILFTNDIQGHIRPDREGNGGLARIATLKKQVKNENPNTILVDAGDAASGTAMAAETKGEAVFHVMNRAGYDAMVIGNHEFDFGKNQVKRFQEIAIFPLLSANIYDQRNNLVADSEYAIFKLGKIRLAVIGISNPATPSLTKPDKIHGLKFLPPLGQVRACQNELGQKADIIIILSHLGLDEDKQLAEKLTGIPLIIGGHSEKFLWRMRRINNVRIAQAGHFAKYLGRVDMFLDSKNKQVKLWKYRLIKLEGDIVPDEAVEWEIKEQIDRIEMDIDRVIGKTSRAVERDWIGRWTAELIKESTRADYAIINTAGIRGGLERGEILASDIYKIMPFDDRLAWFEVSGINLQEMLREKSMYSSSGPGIKKESTYRVGCSDFILDMAVAHGAKNIHRTNKVLRQAMIQKIEADRGLKSFWKK
jgi:2',3'-cyclic-nucleotide 2'-phosphodiesterase (5'-nucleotidase family)